MKTRIFYRVVPESPSYSSQDYDKKEDAVNRANDRNKVRPAQHQIYPDRMTEIYFGDNCKVLEVIEITNEIPLTN